MGSRSGEHKTFTVRGKSGFRYQLSRLRFQGPKLTGLMGQYLSIKYQGSGFDVHSSRYRFKGFQGVKVQVQSSKLKF
jgi:hypothetical protein